MINENQLAMTGSIILGLIWTLLVSTLLFALVGCGGGDDLGADDVSSFAAPQGFDE